MVSLVGKRVVIVEDEGLTVIGLRKICENARLIVSGMAHNARDGIETTIQQRPDIVLMDIRLPDGMNGLEASREILHQIRTCILVVTAYADTTDLGEIVSSGIHGYKNKPVTHDNLIPAIEEAYERFLAGKKFGQ